MGAVSEASEAMQLAFNKLEELTRQYGPQAVDTAAEVVRVNATGDVARMGAAVAVAAIGWTVGVIFLRRSVRLERAHSDGELEGIVALIAATVGIVFTIGASTGALDVWMWTALTNPKLALAHDVLAKIGVAQ